MSLLTLPDELLDATSNSSSRQSDLNSSSQVRCRLFGVAAPILYWRDDELFDTTALLWAVDTGNEDIIRRAIAIGST